MVGIRSFVDIPAVLRCLKIPIPAPPHLMVIQKESGKESYVCINTVGQIFRYPIVPKFVHQSTVDGWLIFFARPIMRCDGGRGTELLVSIVCQSHDVRLNQKADLPPGNSSRLR